MSFDIIGPSGSLFIVQVNFKRLINRAARNFYFEFVSPEFSKFLISRDPAYQIKRIIEKRTKRN